MNGNSSCPLLRENVQVEPSDQVDGLAKFVVAVDWQYFMVDRATACLINALRQPTTYEKVTACLRRELGDDLEVDDVRYAVEQTLPRALFVASSERPKSPLNWQRILISGPKLEPLARIASRLIDRNTAAGVLLVLVLVDTLVCLRWLRAPVALSDGSPWQWPMMMGLIVLGVMVHEFGHVSALRRFNRRSGGIGVGIYWVFPTFYSDVSEAWRLPGKQRAVVDVGGLYFQSIYMIAIGIWAIISSHPATLLLVMWLTHFMMLYTLNPTLKFDGYWLLSDLTRCTNLHSRIEKNARAVVSRLRGKSSKTTLSGDDKLVLAAFSVAAFLYFSYVLASLTSGLIHMIGALNDEAGRGWLSTLMLGIFTAMVAGMLLMIVWRVARVLSTLVRHEVPALESEALR